MTRRKTPANSMTRCWSFILIAPILVPFGVLPLLPRQKHNAAGSQSNDNPRDRYPTSRLIERKAMSITFETATTKSVDVHGTNFVCREIGKKGGVPVVFLHHLTAVLDDWDPKVGDGLAAKHHVIVFDNRGVGRSGGSTPKTVEEMARDAVAFIGALGFSKVDLLGFSLGGVVSQAIAQQQPGLVRKIILAGTGPAGGEGIANVGAVLQDAFGKAGATNKHPKQFLFFTQTKNGQAAAVDFPLRPKQP